MRDALARGCRLYIVDVDCCINYINQYWSY